MVMSSLASACCTWEATERTTVSTIMRTSKVPSGARVDNRRSFTIQLFGRHFSLGYSVGIKEKTVFFSRVISSFGVFHIFQYSYE